MKKDKNSTTTTTTETKIATRKETQQAPLEQKHNDLTPGWNHYLAFASSLPSLGKGLCWIGGFALIVTILYFVWIGQVDPNTIVDATRTYFAK